MSTTNPINRTTEWDDLQIKYGNYAPLAEEVKSEQVSIRAQEALATVDPLENKSLEELKELEDDVEEDVLERYRQRRLEELKKEAMKARFGAVVDIGMSEYVEQVTEASKGDQIVLCLLYKDYIPECKLMLEIWSKLARQHREVKFCQGVSDRLVPNYQDKSLPAILIYHNGSCLKQIIGTTAFGGPGRCSAASVEWVLAKKCRVFKTELTENPLTDPISRRGKKGELARLRVDDMGSSSSDEDEKEIQNDKGYSDLRVDDLASKLR